jgi:polyribonucleotide nucleotidyltransferase
VRLASDLFDVQLVLLRRDELSPGDSAQVGVSFLSPEKAHAHVCLGTAYVVFEGARAIGEVALQRDIWRDPDRVVQVGKEYVCSVTRIEWTAAELKLENGWTATLHSRDVGLIAWAEIGTSLHEGDRLRVRLETVDPTARVVKLSLQQGPTSLG